MNALTFTYDIKSGGMKMKKTISLILLSIMCLTGVSAFEKIGNEADCEKITMMLTNLPFKGEKTGDGGAKLYYALDYSEVIYLANNFKIKPISVCDSNAVVYEVIEESKTAKCQRFSINWWILTINKMFSHAKSRTHRAVSVDDVREAVQDGTYNPDLDMDNNGQIDPRDIIEKRKRDAGKA